MATSDGLPYLIIIVTLVLCSLLLATIALIIVVIVIRQKRQKSRSDSLQDETIAYDDMGKPDTRAMEIQPDLKSLEPRGAGDPRAFMYTSLPFESQRRLIPVPEEEGSADERLTSPEEMFSFPSVYTLGADDDFLADVGLPMGGPPPELLRDEGEETARLVATPDLVALPDKT